MLERRATALRLAAVMAAGVALTGLLALLVPTVRMRDAAAFDGFLGLYRPWLQPTLNDVASLADPAPYALVGLALAAAALARGRRRLAVAVPVVLVASGATTQLLKQLTAAPRPDGWLHGAHVAEASWPSGHATAAMTLALCAVIVAPPRWRAGVAALGAAFVVAVSFSILALGWHFPSDVLGGYFVAAFYALLAVAAVGGLERSPVDARPAVGVAIAAAAITAIVVAQHPAGLAEYAARHTTFVAGAAVIAALACLLAGLLAAGPRLRSARG